MGYSIGAVLMGFIGAAIGTTKGRAGAGFALGLLLGPIGLIIIAVMDRTPALEAQRAREVQRLSAGPARTSGSLTRLRPISEASTASATPLPVQWSHIQEAARQDSSSHTPAAVLRSEQRYRTGVNGPPIWFFADGPFNFIARVDSTLIGASPEQATALEPDASVTFERGVDGEVVAVTIGDSVLLNPRPLPQVTRFLAAIDAKSVPSAPSSIGAESAPAASNTSALTIREALAQLEDLRESNLISEEEHVRKRTEILNRL